MSRTFYLLIWLILMAFLFGTTDFTSGQELKWRVSSYQGLVLGKSTLADVVRAFGKPVWSGAPIYDESEGEVKSEILYEYVDVRNFKGQTSVYFDARTKKIKAISLYPDYRKPIPLKQIFKEYGTDYIERESGLGPCPTAKEIRNYKQKREREYPLTLVYPHRGLYITVGRDNEVQGIHYLLCCP